LDYFSSNPLKKKQNFIEFTENDKNEPSIGIDIDYLSLESENAEGSLWLSKQGFQTRVQPLLDY
jgi:hypothetical protein